MEINIGDVVVSLKDNSGSITISLSRGEMAEVTGVNGNVINLIRNGKESNCSRIANFRKATETEYSYYLQGTYEISNIPSETYSIY